MYIKESDIYINDTEDMYIRKYNNLDHYYVNKIIKDNFGHEMAMFILDKSVDQYVCVKDEEVIGYFVLTKIRNVVRDFYYYLVDYVCTDIDHHGEGVGSFMMEFVTFKATDEDVKYVQLTCSDKREVAQHLYKKFGFEKYDTNVFRRVTK